MRRKTDEKDGELSLRNPLNKRGINYKTGHVIFPGDVIIDGPVADGFKVYSAAHNLQTDFDATDVVAKKILLSGRPYRALEDISESAAMCGQNSFKIVE